MQKRVVLNGTYFCIGVDGHAKRWKFCKVSNLTDGTAVLGCEFRNYCLGSQTTNLGNGYFLKFLNIQ